jgi:WD40 repeat protein
LRGRTGVEIAQAGGRLVKNGFKPGDTRKDGNAVWAMEFSKDGKYLAAGGQDYTVRVWAVISTSEERRAHETEEDADGKNGDNVRLSAPVFDRKPVQEYAGHEASILDISWSKVGVPGTDWMAPHSLTRVEQFPLVILDGQDSAAVAYQQNRMFMLFPAR